jgi:hypothetical protein
MAAMVVLALGASTASAQTPTVEIREEHTGLHCPPIVGVGTAGGCEIHVVGEISLVGHVFGIEATASDCNVELEGRVDEDGEGYVTAAEFSGDLAHNCTRTPCGLPWRLHIDEPSNGALTGNAEFCARPSSGADNRCLAAAPLTDSGDHDYEFTFNDLGGVSHVGADCELTSGSLHIEKGSPVLDHLQEAPGQRHHEIEIIHL